MKKVPQEYVMGAIFGAVLLVACTVLFLRVAPLDYIHNPSDEPLSFEDGWVTEDGTVVNTGRIYELVQDTGVPIVISKQLPSTLPNDSYLNFVSENAGVVIMCKGRILYSFSNEYSPGADNTELFFHHVRVENQLSDKTITLFVIPNYTDTSCRINDIKICSINDYSLYYMKKYGLAFLLSMAITFMGVLMIIQYFSVPRKYHAYNTMALGVASIAVGVWSGIDTDIPLLLLGTFTPQILLIKATILYFAPFPLIAFLSSAISCRSRAAEWVALFTNIAAILIFEACIITGVYTLHEAQFIFFTLLAFIYVVGITVGVRSFIRRKTDPSAKHIDGLTRAAVIICAATLFAFFINYLFEISVQFGSAGILRTGFIIIQIILVVGFMAKGNKNSRAAAENEAVRKLAYVDALTGVGNRTAFDLACDELEAEIEDDDFDFLLVCFDVDDLKKINDKYGHEYGDKHLIAASQALNTAFGDMGQVFRVGGDEFTALIKGGDDALERYEEALARLRAFEAEYNEENPDRKLRVSCGTCLFSETTERTMREVSSMADAAMYADKLAHKAA